MSSVDIHPEELLDKLERGTLTSAERARLSSHLAACEVCRFELTLRRDVAEDARAAGVQDGARTQQPSNPVPELAQRSRPIGRSRLRRWGTAWAAAAALLVLAAVSLASYATGRAWPWSPDTASSAGSAAAGAKPARKTHVKPAQSAVAAPQPAPADATAAAPVERLEALPNAEQETSSASQPSAAALFSAANQARRAGDVPRAIDHYRKLQRRFPSAPEASVSRVVLGRLLLGLDAASALSEFDAYLASGAPSMAAEAWVGRARALSSLGRHEPSRAAWHEVLTRYPHSVYAEEARTTLGLTGPP
ncbi:MAG TPA: zf-HC2 domain-containing protein [Polyangiaceae bacterium]